MNMDTRTAARGLPDIYSIVWDEVGKTEILKDLPVDLRKDIATSIFIQLQRTGFK